VAEIKQRQLVPFPDVTTNVENAKNPAVLNELYFSNRKLHIMLDLL